MVKKNYGSYKYSKRKCDIFIESLTHLSGVVGAAKAAGICYVTYRKWYDSIPEFKEKVDEALIQVEQNGKQYAISQIFKHMDKNWQAGAWWLERNFYDDYGKKERIDQNISYNQPLKLEIVPPNLLPPPTDNLIIDITPKPKELE